MTQPNQLVLNSDYRGTGESPYSFTMTFNAPVVRVKSLGFYKVVFPNSIPTFSEFNNRFQITQGATTESYAIPSSSVFLTSSDFLTYINTLVGADFGGDIVFALDASSNRLSVSSTGATAFHFDEVDYRYKRFLNKIGFSGATYLSDATSFTGNGVYYGIGSTTLTVACNLFHNGSLGAVNGGFQGDANSEGMEIYDFATIIPIDTQYNGIVQDSPNYEVQLSTSVDNLMSLGIRLYDDDMELMTNLPQNFRFIATLSLKY